MTLHKELNPIAFDITSELDDVLSQLIDVALDELGTHGENHPVLIEVHKCNVALNISHNAGSISCVDIIPRQWAPLEYKEADKAYKLILEIQELLNQCDPCTKDNAPMFNFIESSYPLGFDFTRVNGVITAVKPQKA